MRGAALAERFWIKQKSSLAQGYIQELAIRSADPRIRLAYVTIFLILLTGGFLGLLAGVLFSILTFLGLLNIPARQNHYKPRLSEIRHQWLSNHFPSCRNRFGSSGMAEFDIDALIARMRARKKPNTTSARSCSVSVADHSWCSLRRGSRALFCCPPYRPKRRVLCWNERIARRKSTLRNSGQ
jgi:hypothetical protein